jgi:two-component system phosphate regulon response regulator PhoB
LVERDPESERLLHNSLANAGFTVTTLSSGEDAVEAVARHRPHLVVLDWEYPGIVATRLIRHIHSEVPAKRTRLMALSLYSSDHQIVAGLELGLDDYVVRPFSVAVLMARVRAVLRPLRPTPEEAQLLQFERLRVDLTEMRAMIDEHIVRLRPMEFRLLAFLMRYPERVFAREQLLSRVWDRDCPSDERAVDVNIQRTRKALAQFGCGDYLQTVRAFGYRLSGQTRQQRR